MVAGYIVGLINLKYWIIIGGVRTIIHLTLSQLQHRESVSPGAGTTCPDSHLSSQSEPASQRGETECDVMVAALSLNTPTIIMKLVQTKTNSRRKTICAGKEIVECWLVLTSPDREWLVR